MESILIDYQILMKQYREGLRRTVAQEAEFGTSLTIPQFGNKTNPKKDGDKQPLRLLEPDGYDGRLVQAGNHSRSAARNYTGWTQYHSFASLTTNIRIGLFFGLEVHPISFFALKGEFEKLLAHHSGFRTNTTPGYQDYIDDESTQKFYPIFKTEHFDSVADEIFDVMNKEGNLATSTWPEFKMFKSFLAEILAKKHFDKTLDSPALQIFFQQVIERDETTKEGTNDQKDSYWIAKLTWDDLLSRLDDWLLDVQNKTLENEQINLRWRAKFGKYEIELQVGDLKVRELNLKIIRKAEFPEETDEQITREIDPLLHDQKKAIDQESEKVEDAELSVEVHKYISGTGTPMTQEEVNDIKSLCKKLLRQIWKLTFDDVLKQNLKYDQLTENQKLKLRQLFDETITIKKQLGIPNGFFGFNNLTAQTLQTILDRVKIILENAGIDTSSIEYSIQGSSIEEQILWLERENEKLENELIMLQAKFRALVENGNVRTKGRILQDESIHGKVIQDYKEELEKQEKEIKKLKKQYDSMFVADSEEE